MGCSSATATRPASPAKIKAALVSAPMILAGGPRACLAKGSAASRNGKSPSSVAALSCVAACLCQFCPARHAAKRSTTGASAQVQLAGDARQRDHDELRRFVGGLVVISCGAVHAAGPSHGAAQQFDWQRKFSKGWPANRWRHGGFGGCPHCPERAARQPQLPHDHCWLSAAHRWNHQWCCVGQ